MANGYAAQFFFELLVGSFLLGLCGARELLNVKAGAGACYLAWLAIAG